MKQDAGLQNQNEKNYQQVSSAYEGTISYTSTLQMGRFCQHTHLQTLGGYKAQDWRFGKEA